MKIIFLDIDGVLNSTQTCEDWHLRTGKGGYGGFFDEDDMATDENVKWGQKLVDNLRTIVEKTGARIVVSSTWRKHFTVPKFKEMFSVYGWEGAPVYDRTPLMRIRGQEIKWWVQKHKPEAYVIIDDFDDFLREQIPFFVETNPDIGLTSEDAEKAINILNITKELENGK